MGKNKLVKLWGKVWHFIWEDESILSWIVNIILAFVIIKFLVYPGLGLVLGTNYPIVAVVSESMEHRGQNFDTWWSANEAWYTNNGITKANFSRFPLKNGFNKGDIIVLIGKKPANIKVGDVLVFKSHPLYPTPDPVIHRIVKVTRGKDGKNLFQTKGDNNADSIINMCKSGVCINELDIKEDQLLGFSFFRVPYLGYLKIWASELYYLVRGGIKNVLP
jgi:signal peptidase I